MDDAVNSNNIDSLNDLAFELSMDELSEDSDNPLKNFTPTWVLKPRLEIPQPKKIPICLRQLNWLKEKILQVFLNVSILEKQEKYKSIKHIK